MPYQEVAKLFKALGNERRLKILHGLLDSSELTVLDVAQLLGVTHPAAVKHLQCLERVHCVERNRSGQYVLSGLEGESTAFLVRAALGIV